MLTATEQRTRAITRTLWIVLLLNALVASSKLVVGYLVGALSLSADGLHSTLDASANVLGLVGIRFARRPPDADHPYGHQRFETLAALGIGLLIGFGFLGVAGRFVAALLHGSAAPEVTAYAVACVVLTVLLNVAISRYEQRRGRQLQSSVLAADAAHTQSDALAAAAILVGFGLVRAGLPWGDLLATAVVCVFIARTAWDILRQNLSILADVARLDPEAIRAIVLAVPGVRGTHRIRSRGSPEHVQLDLHIHLEPSMPLVEAHAKSHEVCRAIQSVHPEVRDVVIHVEPADGRERNH